ncbi:MAG: YggT family protein [Magnetococcales bacterium]|nr:YggT family protein [Magnetococcales bacterium]
MGITGSIGTLLNFLLEIYAWLILGRVLLSWVNPDPYNPIVQFLVRATEPVLEPFRRWIPSFAGLDLSPIVALLAVHFIQRIVVTLFQGGMGGGAIGSLIAELLGILHLLLTFYMLLLFARGGFHVHSWRTFRKGLPPGIDLRKPLIRFVFQATEPVLRPLRGFVPTVSGMDVSPFAAAVAVLVLLSILQELMLGVAGTRIPLHG